MSKIIGTTSSLWYRTFVFWIWSGQCCFPELMPKYKIFAAIFNIWHHLASDLFSDNLVIAATFWPLLLRISFVITSSSVHRSGNTRSWLVGAASRVFAPRMLRPRRFCASFAPRWFQNASPRRASPLSRPATLKSSSWWLGDKFCAVGRCWKPFETVVPLFVCYAPAGKTKCCIRDEGAVIGTRATGWSGNFLILRFHILCGIWAKIPSTGEMISRAAKYFSAWVFISFLFVAAQKVLRNRQLIVISML